jgi:hypothetical protein
MALSADCCPTQPSRAQVDADTLEENAARFCDTRVAFLIPARGAGSFLAVALRQTPNYRIHHCGMKIILS